MLFRSREGHVLPYDTRDPNAGLLQTISLMNGDMGRFRMDDLYLLDLRAEKTFAATSDVNLTFGVDLFNVFNAGTVLSRQTTLRSRQTTLSSSQADYLLDIVSPRIWKLGVRISWK